MSHPQVSVVIAARNAQVGLTRLLAALGHQTLPAEEMEVLVVDDASQDATAAVAAEAGVQVIRCERHRGSYGARNLALARACAPVVAVTDADCVPRPGWLEGGLAALEEQRADLVGGAVLMALSARPTLAEAVDVARNLDQERAVRDGFAVTANLFVRRAVFEAIGPFNERLRSGGDAEFTRRAVAAGFRLVYAEEAVVDHAPRRTGASLARKAFRAGYGFGQVRRVGVGRAAERPRLWTRPRQWRPRRTLLGMHRLEAQGYRPSAVRRVALDVTQYLFHQLPLVIGSLVESVTRGRRGLPRS